MEDPWEPEEGFTRGEHKEGQEPPGQERPQAPGQISTTLVYKDNPSLDQIPLAHPKSGQQENFCAACCRLMPKDA